MNKYLEKLSFTLHSGPNYKLGLSNYHFNDINIVYFNPDEKVIKIYYDEVSDSDIFPYVLSKFFGKQEELGYIYGDVKFINDLVVFHYNLFDIDEYGVCIQTKRISPEFDEDNEVVNKFDSVLYMQPTEYIFQDSTSPNKYIYEMDCAHQTVSDSEWEYSDYNKSSFSVADGHDHKKRYILLENYPNGYKEKLDVVHSNFPLNQQTERVTIDGTLHIKHKEKYFDFYHRFSSNPEYAINRYKNILYDKQLTVPATFRGCAKFELAKIYEIPYWIEPIDNPVLNSNLGTPWLLDLRNNRNPRRDWKFYTVATEPGFVAGIEVTKGMYINPILDLKLPIYVSYLNGQFLTDQHICIDFPTTYGIQIPEFSINEVFNFYTNPQPPLQEQGTVASNIDYAVNAINKVGAVVASALNITVGIKTPNPYALARGVSGSFSALSGLIDWNSGLNNNPGKREGSVQDNVIHNVSVHEANYFVKNFSDILKIKPKYVQQRNDLKGITSPILEMVYD